MNNLLSISDSKKYNNLKIILSVIKGIASFLIILAFLNWGFSKNLVLLLNNYSSNSYLVFLLFSIFVTIGGVLIFAPLNYFTGFYLEHKFNLSNQSFFAWVWEGAKAMLVGSVIGIPILILFFWVLNTFNSMWWLPFSVLMFIISVVLAQIVPILIIPIFYKMTPLDNGDLKDAIVNLAKAVGMKVENVFTFNMSKKTKKANAAFTGLGKTKRIILGDTLVNSYSTDQIETVMAHELGHYKHKHIVKNILINTLLSFLTFFLIAQLYEISLAWFDFSNILEIAALPLLSLWAMIIGIIEQPFSNYISRKFEYQADEYAIKSTGKKEAFISTLNKLTDQNLGDKEPHPFVEWFFYSHPSIKNRVNYINTLKL